MCNKSNVAAGGHKATYKTITEKRFDSAVFKADNPEMYEKYKLPKDREYYRFS